VCGGLHRDGLFDLFVSAPVLQWKEAERGESELDTPGHLKFWRVDLFILCDNNGAAVVWRCYLEICEFRRGM
jgi:hypothetical protein